MAKPETIQIFLPDGNPRGVRIADITNRTVKAILFPRKEIDYALTRRELHNVGFYFLFGDSADGSPMVYIGEAENFAERIRYHHNKKDSWNYAVVIISKINAFTKSHVKFLEHLALKRAREIGRWKLDNSSAPNLPHVTESMEADLMECFDTAKVLLSTLGFPLFDTISRPDPKVDSRGVYHKGGEHTGRGNNDRGGFCGFQGLDSKTDHIPFLP